MPQARGTIHIFVSGNATMLAEAKANAHWLLGLVNDLFAFGPARAHSQHGGRRANVWPRHPKPRFRTPGGTRTHERIGTGGQPQMSVSDNPPEFTSNGTCAAGSWSQTSGLAPRGSRVRS